MDKLRIADQITFIYCSDLEKTAAFYEGLLGFELVLDQGVCRIVRPAGGTGAYLGYCVGGKGEPRPEGVIITLVTPQVDDWHRYLQDRGAPILDPPSYNADFGIYHFFFKDPDGYRLEIQDFADPGWKGELTSE